MKSEIPPLPPQQLTKEELPEEGTRQWQSFNMILVLAGLAGFAYLIWHFIIENPIIWVFFWIFQQVIFGG